MPAVVPVIGGVAAGGDPVQEGFHGREVLVGDGVVLVRVIQEDLRSGRRGPSGRKRVAPADRHDAVVGIAPSRQEILVQDVRQVVGAELLVDFGEGEFLGQDPVLPVVEQGSLEEVAVGNAQLMGLVDADHAQGDERDGVAEGAAGIGVPGQFHVEGAAAAHHFLEADGEFGVPGDILEIGHGIEPALRVAEAVQPGRDGDFPVFQQLAGGQVCVDVAARRGLRVQVGLGTVRAGAEAVVVGHHHGIVLPGQGPLELGFHRGAFGIGGDGAVVGQGDAGQGLGAVQDGVGDVEEGRQFHRFPLRVRGEVGIADGAGGLVAVGEDDSQHELVSRQQAGKSRLIQQILLGTIGFHAGDVVIAPGLSVRDRSQVQDAADAGFQGRGRGLAVPLPERLEAGDREAAVRPGIDRDEIGARREGAGRGFRPVAGTVVLRGPCKVDAEVRDAFPVHGHLQQRGEVMERDDPVRDVAVGGGDERVGADIAPLRDGLDLGEFPAGGDVGRPVSRALGGVNGVEGGVSAGADQAGDRGDVPVDGRDFEDASHPGDMVIDGQLFADLPDGAQPGVEGRAGLAGHRDRPGPFDQALFRRRCLRDPLPDAGDERQGGEEG